MKSIILFLGMLVNWPAFSAKPIQHDEEHYVLLHQHKDKWAAEDKEIDERLAALRKANGGQPPNIVYILIDYMGFGEFGMPVLNKIRGNRTPKLDKFARQGASFTRFYAENICTSTRVAFMTGRYAVRTGMELTKVTPPEGVGLNAKEVTLPEILSDAGYTTHHIGKWPDWQPARGMPCGDVENLRPETKKMVELWARTYGDARHVVGAIEAIGN